MKEQNKNTLGAYAYHNRYRFDNIFLNPLVLNNFLLEQLGELACEADTIVHDHEQTVCEISFIVSGKGTFFTNNVPTPVVKGNAYLSLPGDTHRIESSSEDPLRYCYIAFSPRENSPILSFYRELCAACASPRQRLFDLPYCLTEISYMLSEISRKNEGHQIAIDCTLQKILVQMYRFKSNSANSVYCNSIKSNKTLVYNVITYIDNHFLEINNLNQLADEFSYSLVYIAKLFNQVAGKTIYEYLQEKKFDHALYLMLQEHRNIQDVTEILGYASPGNFSRAFKKHFGMSPQQYLLAKRFS